MAADVATTPSQAEIERLRDEAEHKIADEYGEQAVIPFLAAAASTVLASAPPFLAISMLAAAASAAVGVSVVVAGPVLALAVRAARLVAPDVDEAAFATMVRTLREQTVNALTDEAHAAVSEVIQATRGHSPVAIGIAVKEVLDPRSSKWKAHVDKTAATLATAAIAEGISIGAAQVQQRTGRRLALKWVSRRDAAVRPSHRLADGQVRGLGQRFDVGGALLRWPADPLGPAEEVILCRCVLVPVRLA